MIVLTGTVNAAGAPQHPLTLQVDDRLILLPLLLLVYHTVMNKAKCCDPASITGRLWHNYDSFIRGPRPSS